MNRLPLLLGALAIAGIAACTQKTASNSTGSSDAVAVVDNYVVTRSLYDHYVNSVSNGAENLTPEQKNGLLENLVRGQLLASQAEATGASRDEEARNAMELQRLNIMSLSQAASKAFLKDKKPTEAEMRAEYDERLKTMDKVEYRASHILVKDEEEARKIIAQLNAGGNFAAIARAKSTDTVSAAKGGDLEWFSPAAMTPEFANAVTALKKGETSAAPAKTEYGYHVIRVTDMREPTPPPFEEVKEQMAQAVDAKKLKAWVDELTKNAKIKKSL
jgi:peptidyl-prolyl cis-trans isomerase C